MKRTIAYLLVLGMLALPKTQANIAGTSEVSKLEKKVETKTIIDDSKPDTLIFKEYIQNIKPPKYNLEKGFCARYARISAKRLYKKEYSWGHSWNMIYRNKIISNINDSLDIYKLINAKQLLPGMIIGFQNPHSKYKNKKDDSGKKVKYTHVALYVGVNKNLEPEFIHQEGSRIKKSTIKEMYKEKFKPFIVLDEPEKNQEI